MMTNIEMLRELKNKTYDEVVEDLDVKDIKNFKDVQNNLKLKEFLCAEINNPFFDYKFFFKIVCVLFITLIVSCILHFIFPDSRELTTSCLSITLILSIVIFVMLLVSRLSDICDFKNFKEKLYEEIQNAIDFKSSYLNLLENMNKIINQDSFKSSVIKENFCEIFNLLNNTYSINTFFQTETEVYDSDFILLIEMIQDDKKTVDDLISYTYYLLEKTRQVIIKDFPIVLEMVCEKLEKEKSNISDGNKKEFESLNDRFADIKFRESFKRQMTRNRYKDFDKFLKLNNQINHLIFSHIKDKQISGFLNDWHLFYFDFY